MTMWKALLLLFGVAVVSNYAYQLLMWFRHPEDQDDSPIAASVWDQDE